MRPPANGPRLGSFGQPHLFEAAHNPPVSDIPPGTHLANPSWPPILIRQGVAQISPQRIRTHPQPLRLCDEVIIVDSIMAVRTKIKMWSLKTRRGKQIYAHVMLGLRQSRALQRHVLLFSDTPPCPACGIGLVRCRLLHSDQSAWICFECGHGRCVGTSADGPPRYAWFRP